jgi:hypothetical protein
MTAAREDFCRSLGMNPGGTAKTPKAWPAVAVKACHFASFPFYFFSKLIPPAALAIGRGSLGIHGPGGERYDNLWIGLIAWLDSLSAAMPLTKFEIFPEEVELRRKVA